MIIFRFLKALYRYAVYGHFKKVPFNVFSKRINQCSNCEYLNKDKWNCSVCGCFLIKKSQWITEDCPKSKWN